MIRYLFLAQVSLWGLLLVCCLLLPYVIFGNYGLSYFGVTLKTIIPYAMGMLGCSVLLFRASRLARRRSRLLARSLTLLATLMVGVLLTPYSVNPLFSFAHVVVSGSLFVCELLLAKWLVRLFSNRWNKLLLSVQFFSSLLAALALLGLLELMTLAQMMAQLAFGTLLIRGANCLTRPILPIKPSATVKTI